MTEQHAASTDAPVAGAGPSPDDLAWEDRPAVAPSHSDGIPVLRVTGLEGPLDWVLEQARAGRIDLAHVPVLALVEQCVAAVTAALAPPSDVGAAGDGGELAPAPLQRLGEWLIMAAWLVWLRSRLLLPAGDPEARAAREEAEALRRQLADRARVRAMATALDGLPQLSRDVFARGSLAPAPGVLPGNSFAMVPTAPPAPVERIADLATLLRACARLLGSPSPLVMAAVYRPEPPLLWRLPDALARIQRLLPAVLGAAPPEDAGLWCFLPAAEDLERRAAARPGTAPHRAVLGRSAVASTFAAGLELARQGQLALAQKEVFGPIHVRRAAMTP